MHKVWDTHFEKFGPNAYFIQFCHSDGVSEVKGSLKAYPEELRKRIIVIGVAPSRFVEDKECHSAYHLISKSDRVYLAGTGDIKNCSNVSYLTPHENATYWDHEFISETYVPKIKKLFKYIIQNK